MAGRNPNDRPRPGRQQALQEQQAKAYEDARAEHMKRVEAQRAQFETARAEHMKRVEAQRAQFETARAEQRKMIEARKAEFEKTPAFKAQNATYELHQERMQKMDQRMKDADACFAKFRKIHF